MPSSLMGEPGFFGHGFDGGGGGAGWRIRRSGGWGGGLGEGGGVRERRCLSS